MSTRNITLTDQLNRFVDDQIAAGRFKNASEVLQAGLLLLEHQTCEHQEKLSRLRSMAVDAFRELDEGRSVTLNGAKELARFVGQIGRQVSTHPRRE